MDTRPVRIHYNDQNGHTLCFQEGGICPRIGENISLDGKRYRVNLITHDFLRGEHPDCDPVYQEIYIKVYSL